MSLLENRVLVYLLNKSNDGTSLKIKIKNVSKDLNESYMSIFRVLKALERSNVIKKSNSKRGGLKLTILAMANKLTL